MWRAKRRAQRRATLFAFAISLERGAVS